MKSLLSLCQKTHWTQDTLARRASEGRRYAHPPSLARRASVSFPTKLLHGDQDPQVPINQAHELHGRYKELKLPVQFEVVHGAAHGGPQFTDERRIALVATFLDQHLRGAQSPGQKSPP
nr:prolyl oligopeptidase family serine peptidase [Planctomycetota bacterium]